VKSILVDTHAAIWYLLNSKKLSATAEETIDRAETICLCSIFYLNIPLVTRDTKIQALNLETIW
jgi:PIN domain nuclease of toxin-antitoxin system